MASPSESQTTPLLALAGVTKTYEDGEVQALRGVTLDIMPGDFVTIMGPSGCGKSTLLNMLGALDRPTSGEVWFEGERVDTGANLDRLRAQRIGFVFQSFYLLPNLTAQENVQIPMFETSRSMVDRESESGRLLDIVGLSDRKTHLPNQLSIGQRQRVAIARALANGPSIVLADEPTGSLDSQNGREVMQLLVALNKDHGTTLVIVTHDEEVANSGKRLIRMLDGQIVDETLL